MNRQMNGTYNILSLKKQESSSDLNRQFNWSNELFFLKIVKKLGLKNDKFEFRKEKAFKSERRPDFVVIKHSEIGNINLLYASFVVELQVGKKLDDEHKGKLVMYNEEVLNSNPCRKFITSVLTNLQDMVLIKSEMVTEDQDNIQIYHTISKNIAFWTNGVKFIKQMHDKPETAGYQENLNFYIEISKGF